MILVANRIFVAPSYAQGFEELFATRARLVDGMPGFIANQVLRPVSRDQPYIVQTLWESKAHFVAWTKSEEFTAGHARTGTLPKEAFSAPTTLEIYEVFQQTLWPGGSTDDVATPS